MRPQRMLHFGIGEKVKDARVRLSWKVFGHCIQYCCSSKDIRLKSTCSCVKHWPSVMTGPRNPRTAVVYVAVVAASCVMVKVPYRLINHTNVALDTE